MAEASRRHHPIHRSIRLLPVLLLPILLQATTAMPTNKGFTVELIHRYSKRSPYYNDNLTESQLLERLGEQSRSNVEWLESKLVANTTALRPHLLSKQALYLVKLSIGTGDGKKSYFLHLDTGSSLTWIQCDPCHNCFDQPSPLFEPYRSPTYHPIRHDSRICTRPYGSDSDGNCAYQVTYMDGTSTSGVLSEDTFTIQSDRRGRPEAVPHVVFGCAKSTTIAQHRVGGWDGIFGVGNLPVSIPRQLHEHFTYCLVKPRSTNPGYLQIGGEFPPPRGRLQTTRIQTLSRVDHYYLDLIDISIADERLHLPPGTFAHHRSPNGCVIDTGTYFSYLIRRAYDRVRQTFVEHFQSLGLASVTRRGDDVMLDLCYATPNNPESVLPHMTLHFQGADYRIGWEKVFKLYSREHCFCWTMLRNDHFTVLGALHQYDIRFSFDIEGGRLSFAPENCERAAHR